MAAETHKPVLLNEILNIFDPQSGEVYIDATVNGGGHAKAILERIGERGTLLGIDWDGELIQKLKAESERLKINNLKLVCANYVNLRTIAGEYNLERASGIIFDLGFSSHHLKESGRGFSFLRDEPLDMRYNPHETELTAEKIINTWPGKTIENVFREYGEERNARRIASRIIEYRAGGRILRTAELAKIIEGVCVRGSKIHPATRVFQALRIAVNDELGNLRRALAEVPDILRAGGRIAVISFHSLEDRIVKSFFQEQSRCGLISILTKKPVRPSQKEIKNNPGARSAKLRAGEKI